MPLCIKCKEEKSYDNFHYRKDRKKYYTQCKLCWSLKGQHWRNNNKQYLIDKSKKYYLDNKQRILSKTQEYQIENCEKISIRTRKYRDKTQKHRAEYNKKYIQDRRKLDPCFRLKQNCSRIMRRMLQNKSLSKKGTFLDICGCSLDELRFHLESLFEPWMNWENYGSYQVKIWDDNDCLTWTWVIDHIVPQADFVFSSQDDPAFKQCWSLTNLRPYSAKQNCLDGNRRKRKNDK